MAIVSSSVLINLYDFFSILALLHVNHTEGFASHLFWTNEFPPKGLFYVPKFVLKFLFVFQVSTRDLRTICCPAPKTLFYVETYHRTKKKQEFFYDRSLLLAQND